MGKLSSKGVLVSGHMFSRVCKVAFLWVLAVRAREIIVIPLVRQVMP